MNSVRFEAGTSTAVIGTTGSPHPHACSLSLSLGIRRLYPSRSFYGKKECEAQPSFPSRTNFYVGLVIDRFTPDIARCFYSTVSTGIALSHCTVPHIQFASGKYCIDIPGCCEPRVCHIIRSSGLSSNMRPNFVSFLSVLSARIREQNTHSPCKAGVYLYVRTCDSAIDRSTPCTSLDCLTCDCTRP